MEELEVKDYFAAWSDFVSLLLLGFAFATAGIDPRRRVWGRSILRRSIIALAVSINFIFSAVRLIGEGIFVETGPREFLLVSVIYCARWMWLFVGISRSGSRSRKAFEVALHLKRLRTIRLGTSTRKPNSESKTQSRDLTESCRAYFSQMLTWGKASKKQAGSSTEQESDHDKRIGAKELVIRRGERTVSGTVYWRGVEEMVKVFQRGNSRSDKIYFVRLVEPELHSNYLDEIGTHDFKRKLDIEGLDELYKKIYDLVLTCESRWSALQVDYSSFLVPFKEVAPNTAQAIRTGATLKTDLGAVARRVAADACYYVAHDTAEQRTELHVKFINDCLESAAKIHLGINDENIGDAGTNLSNSESNV